MQKWMEVAFMEWEHLRTFATIVRLGSLTAAAAELKISQSTVSRHLKSLEELAQTPLLFRETPIRLTRRGEALHEAVQPMIQAAMQASAALEDPLVLQGPVTVTTVAEWLRWVLVPGLPAFLETYPQIQLRLLAGNQVDSLAAGVADVAIRVAKPERGDLFARRLHTETYHLYASPHLYCAHDVPWLGLHGSLAEIPEQKMAERLFRGREARLLVEDVESLGRAVKAGLGVALLPDGLAQMLGGLLKLELADLGLEEVALPTRDFWLVVHRSKQGIARIRAVMDWLVETSLSARTTTLQTKEEKQSAEQYGRRKAPL